MQAWGAYLVTRDRRLELVPDLLTILAAYQPDQPECTVAHDRHDALLAVLDALIQLDVDAPVNDLMKIYPEFKAQSLLLMSRSSDDNTTALLEILRTENESSSAWVTAGNMLLARRAPGFAATVLDSLTVHATLAVLSPNSGWGSGGGSLCCGLASRAQPKAGWPQVGNYSLFICKGSRIVHGTMLAPGPDPAWFQRTVDAQYTPIEDFQCGCRPDLESARQQYLTALLDASQENPPIYSYISQNLTFATAAGYKRDVMTFIKQQQQLFASLAERLQRAGLITPEERSSIGLRLVIGVLDLRDDRTVDLPQILDRPDGASFLPSNI
jgi:hypothetical protein